MFLSRRYRPNKWPFYVLIALEAPLTVACLALFGIAAPDLYRTKLWQAGADNGWNSNPNAELYAAANYRSYHTPKVWSQFITDYNVVISVLSMFIMLAKSIMYITHVFPPILSAVTHAALFSLYAVSISYQSGSDTSDPAHPQHGAPWYLTKSCAAAHEPAINGYCVQAKAAFACTCVMTALFVCYFGFAVWSCFPSTAHRAEYAEKKERYSTPKKDEYDMVPATPYTPGMPQLGQGVPATPRTQAFNRLGGTNVGGTSRGLVGDRAVGELPLRKHFSSPNAPKSPMGSKFSQPLRSPEFPGSSLSPGFARAEAKADEEMAAQQQQQGSEMYFPPPPKMSGGKK